MRNSLGNIIKLKESPEHFAMAKEKKILQDKHCSFYLLVLSGGNNGVLASLYNCDVEHIGQCEINLAERAEDHIVVELEKLRVAKRFEGLGLGKLMAAGTMEFASRHAPIKFKLRQDPTRVNDDQYDDMGRPLIGYNRDPVYMQFNANRQAHIYEDLGFKEVDINGIYIDRETQIYPKGQTFLHSRSCTGHKIHNKVCLAAPSPVSTNGSVFPGR